MNSSTGKATALRTLASLLALLPLAALAQPAPDWSVNMPGATGAMIALDAGNQVLVAGTGGASATPAMTLTKLSATGATVWQRSVDNAGMASRSTAVAVDAAGNAIVTGMLVDAAGAVQGAVVAKFDGAGTLLWRQATATPNELAWQVRTDIAGNVYVLGRTPQASGTGAITQQMTLTKFSPAGLRLWARSYGASSVSDEALAVTPGGQVVVTGFGAVPAQSVLVVFDAAGNPLVSKSFDATGGLSLALGRGGEVVVAGAGSSGFLVAKLDAQFNTLWQSVYPARGGARRVAVDSVGHIVVSGIGNTSTGSLLAVRYDWLTLKLDANGGLLWSRTYGQDSPIDDVPYGLALGADDAVYLTGQGNAATTDASGSTYFAASAATVKYTADGTQAWAAVTPAASPALGLKLGSDRGVVVLAFSPLTVLRYPQSGQPNVAPTAAASASTSAGPAPLAVYFSSTGSADADGSIASYTWNFGDGQSSTGPSASHTYAAGSYAARLTVTDNQGASATSAPIAITANATALPPQPKALVFDKPVLVGGNSTAATVTVTSAAGVTVTLSSSNTTVVKVPAKVSIPAGATSARFTLTSARVRKDTAVTVRATANGVTTSALLTVKAR
ncbi:PKD domain-containing protein [Ideonella sp. A 288]|uniref:PKD domain-containing protein n=1 Tax=Ideonella sp. A 288 TaxID=1962181 RepID=UPI0018FE54F9|nr:PKD domain-containing protein [Ideonella sp. A 288]